ncbi:MAG: molybdopterin-dependent oxidoreductase [Candidatus Bathyarchaeota archaeon]
MRTTLMLALILLVLGAHQVEPAAAQEFEPVLRIYGLVERPLNITYSEFLGLPMVSVEASCICVGAPPENPGVNSFVVYTYNWTGVRLSHLLGLAGVRDGAVDVVFQDDTQYSSSLPLTEAGNPDFIIAVYADGETLNRDQGYPFRLVAPCWWGYKWVKYVERVEVVDYDHLGFWESHGYPDDARIPDCTYTTSSPEVFTSTSMSLQVLGVLCISVALVLTYAEGRR